MWQNNKIKTVDRIVLNTRNIQTSPPSLVVGFFLFNLFVDIMDNYEAIAGSSVGVYLRINDPGNPQQQFEFFKKSGSNNLDTNALEKCDASIVPGLTKKNSPQELIDLPRDWIPAFKNIKFKNIYDMTIQEPDILARYMMLAYNLSKGRSIALMTYGYSGVGKTYTLFGTDGKMGMLQPTLQAISNSDKIFMRTYEIYGTALPYKPYWTKIQDAYIDPITKTKNTAMPKYNHKVYTYTPDKIDGEADASTTPEILEHSPAKNMTSMKAYLDAIKGTDTGLYTKIDNGFILKFSKFVDAIDKIREREGRIKATVNNPSSSRSIMVYEFKIKLKNEKMSKLVIIDLPGKENIKSTYVDTGKDEVALKHFGIKLSATALTYNPSALFKAWDYDGNITSATVSVNEHPWYTRALRAGIFLNPMLMCVFPNIAGLFVKYIERDTTLYNANSTIDKQGVVTKKYIFNANGKDGRKNSVHLKPQVKQHLSKATRTDWDVDWVDDPASKSTNEPLYEYKHPLNQLITSCWTALEYFKQLIDLNKVDVIIDFLNDNLIDHTTDNDDINTKKKKPAALPFEGIYINENIIGLTRLLKKRLKQNTTYPIVPNFYSMKMLAPYRENPDHPHIPVYNDEIHSLIFYTRFLIAYSWLLKPEQVENDTNTDLIKANKVTHLFNNDCSTNLDNDEAYTKLRYRPNEAKDVPTTLQAVFEESYNFNKSFTENPPIETFMEAYFGEENYNAEGTTEKKHVIDNFYLFYVVQNQSVDRQTGTPNNDSLAKCANQIKLIYDSMDLIEAIETFGSAQEKK